MRVHLSGDFAWVMQHSTEHSLTQTNLVHAHFSAEFVALLHHAAADSCHSGLPQCVGWRSCAGICVEAMAVHTFAEAC
jgi:hypothetical protein